MEWYLILLATSAAEWIYVKLLDIGFSAKLMNSEQTGSKKKYSRTLLQLYEISLFLFAGYLGSADRKACCEGIVFIFVCVVTLIIYVDAVFVWMRC